MRKECGTTEHAKRILEVRDHVKAEERAKERAEVIGKVREQIERQYWLCGGSEGVGVFRRRIQEALDELEQEGR